MAINSLSAFVYTIVFEKPVSLLIIALPAVATTIVVTPLQRLVAAFGFLVGLFLIAVGVVVYRRNSPEQCSPVLYFGAGLCMMLTTPRTFVTDLDTIIFLRTAGFIIIVLAALWAFADMAATTHRERKQKQSNREG
jgi:uncharacterized membrane protein